LSKPTEKEEPKNDKGAIHSIFLEAYIQKPNPLGNNCVTRDSSGRRDGRFALVKCGRLEVESGRSRSAYSFLTFHLPPPTSR